MLAVAGVTETVATGAGGVALTVIVAVSALPSTVAITPTEPADSPVTSPDDDTVAIAGLRLVQVTARPVSSLPLASRADALSCTVLSIWIVALAGVTTTLATAAGAAVTVIDAVSALPSLVA